MESGSKAGYLASQNTHFHCYESLLEKYAQCTSSEFLIKNNGRRIGWNNRENYVEMSNKKLAIIWNNWLSPTVEPTHPTPVHPSQVISFLPTVLIPFLYTHLKWPHFYLPPLSLPTPVSWRSLYSWGRHWCLWLGPPLSSLHRLQSEPAGWNTGTLPEWTHTHKHVHGHTEIYKHVITGKTVILLTFHRINVCKMQIWEYGIHLYRCYCWLFELGTLDTVHTHITCTQYKCHLWAEWGGCTLEEGLTVTERQWRWHGTQYLNGTLCGQPNRIWDSGWVNTCRKWGRREGGSNEYTHATCKDLPSNFQDPLGPKTTMVVKL